MPVIPAADENDSYVESLERAINPADELSPVVLGVPSFEYRYGNVGSGVASLIRERLASAGAGRFVLSPTGDIEAAAGSVNLDAGKLYSGRRSIDFSLLGGMDYLLVGRVREFKVERRKKKIGHISLSSILADGASASVILDFAIVSVRENRVIFEASAYGRGKSDFFKVSSFDTWQATLDFYSPTFGEHPAGEATLIAVDEAAEKVLGIFPFDGRIVERTGATVIVGFDTRAPVEVGDSLRVTRTYERLDSAGNVVWVGHEDVGTLRVFDTRGAYALCEILRGLNDVRVGMRVKLLDHAPREQ